MKRAVAMACLGSLVGIAAWGAGCTDRDDDAFAGLPELGADEAGVQADPARLDASVLLDAGVLLDASLGQDSAAPSVSEAGLPDAAWGVPVWGESSGSSGAACRVNGVTYPSGTRAVPDPRSCNTCSCQDGTLTDCTTSSCPNACTTGSAFGFSCAGFGLAGCTVNEFGCRPACAGDGVCGAPATCDRKQGVCWIAGLAP